MLRLIILITVMVYVIETDCRTMGPLPQEYYLKNPLTDHFNHRPPRNGYKTGSHYMDEFLLPHDKRALAMIARWGPFSNLGKQKTPIRSSYLDPEANAIQTRGRIVGGPLRWG